MGSSDGSQDRNQDTSDKETQSPMIKVFKDMMKREANIDPEKVSLIYPPKEEKKRKKHSHSHSKTKFTEERRFEPTTLDQAKSQLIYNMSPVHDLATDRPDRKYSLPNTQCYCSTSEKESKSGVSCALQRLINVEHSRLACFAVAMVVSVAIACAMVYSGVPEMGRSYFSRPKGDQAAGRNTKDTELEKIKNHLERSRADEHSIHPASYYRDEWPSAQRSLTSNVEFSDPDESEYGARGVEYSAVKDDVRNVKDFYQKFVETDALIKDLKRRINGYRTDDANDVTRGTKDSMYRYKRSMKSPIGSQYRRSFRASNIGRVNNDIFKDNNANGEIFELHRLIKNKDHETEDLPKQKFIYGKHFSGKPTRFIIERHNYVVRFDNVNRDGKILKINCSRSHGPEEGSKRERHLEQYFLDNEKILKHSLRGIPDAVNVQSSVESTKNGGRQEDTYMELPQQTDSLFRLSFRGNKKKDLEPKPPNGTEESFTLKVGNKSLVFDDKEYMKDLMNEENLNDIEENLKKAQMRGKTNHKGDVEDISAQVSTILHPNENKNQETRTPLRPNIRKLMQANEIPETEESPLENIRTNTKVVQDLQDALQLKANLNFAGSEELNRIIKNAVLQNVFIGFHEATPILVESQRLDRDLSEVEKLEQEIKEKILANELNSDPKSMKIEPESPDLSKTNMRKLMQINEDEVVGETPIEEGKDNTLRFNLIERPQYEVNKNSDSMKMHNVLYPSLSKSDESIKFTQNAAFESRYVSVENAFPICKTLSVTDENTEEMRSIENEEVMSTPGFTAKTSKQTSQMEKGGASTKPVYVYSRRLLQHTPEQENDSDEAENDVGDDNTDSVNSYMGEEEKHQDNTWLTEEKIEYSGMNRQEESKEKNGYSSSEPSSKITAGKTSAESAKIGRRLLQLEELHNDQGLQKEVQFEEISNREGLNHAVNINQTISNKNYLEGQLPKVYLVKSRALLSVIDSHDKPHETANTAAEIDENPTVTSNYTSTRNIKEVVEKRDNITMDSTKVDYLNNVTNPLAHNKTIVKRDALSDEDNVIFWNDIDDDERGMDVSRQDSLFKDDNTKKEENWLSKKIHHMKRYREGQNKNKTHPKENVKNINRPKFLKQTVGKERSAPESESSGPYDRKESLEKLSANIENVFKQAADAVHEMRSPEVSVRQEKDVQNDETSSMMQQLVTLMGDLVNYQVQQKTCVTQPSTRPAESISRPNSEKEAGEDPRSECLGTLRAVQDLLQEYDRMSDSDKSKLTGVKEYLEVQLDYLQRQLTGYHGGAAKARRLKKNEPPQKRRIAKIPMHKTDRDLDEKIHNNVKSPRKSMRNTDDTRKSYTNDETKHTADDGMQRNAENERKSYIYDETKRNANYEMKRNADTKRKSFIYDGSKSYTDDQQKRNAKVGLKSSTNDGIKRNAGDGIKQNAGDDNKSYSYDGKISNTDDNIEDIEAQIEDFQKKNSERESEESLRENHDFSRERRNAARMNRKLNNFYRRRAKPSNDTDSKLINKAVRRTKEVIKAAPETKEETRANSEDIRPKLDMKKESGDKKIETGNYIEPYVFDK